MTTGFASDFKVYQTYINGRINEVLAQNANIFNGASGGAIRLTNAGQRGDYRYESLFANISGLAARRDPTSVSPVTDVAMTQDEYVKVKMNRKIIPIAQTRDAFRKISATGNFDLAEFSDILAEKVAVAEQVEMCDTALLAARSALKQQSTSYYTESSLGTISTQTLVNMLKKMGDRADRVKVWVMHSKVYYDLVLNQIGANITNVSNFNVATGTPVTLNRPVLITDSASLKTQLNSPDIDNYFTLGLTDMGVEVENTEQQDIVIQDVTGLESLAVRYQGEYAYNIGVKGFKWDVSNGHANPDSTAVALGTNWDTCLQDAKDRAGVVGMTL